MPYGDIVYTKVYMKSRMMYSAGDDDFRGWHALWRTGRRWIPSILPNSFSVSRYGAQKFPY